MTNASTNASLSQLSKLATLVFLSAFLCGCSFRYEKPGTDAAGTSMELSPDYISLRAAVFEPKCATCHSGPSSPHGIDLSSYDNIVRSAAFPPLVVPREPQSSSLYASITSGAMPKGLRKLPEREIQVIAEWIRLGAPEKPGAVPQPSPVPEEDTGDEDDDWPNN